MSSSTKDNNNNKKIWFIPKGFAGRGPNGSFFEAPEWVDQSKPPGLTPVPDPPGENGPKTKKSEILKEKSG